MTEKNGLQGMDRRGKVRDLNILSDTQAETDVVSYRLGEKQCNLSPVG